MISDDISNIVHLNASIPLIDPAKAPNTDAIHIRSAKPEAVLHFPKRHSSAQSDKLLRPLPTLGDSTEPIVTFVPEQSATGWPNRFNPTRTKSSLKVVQPKEIRCAVVYHQFGVKHERDGITPDVSE